MGNTDNYSFRIIICQPTLNILIFYKSDIEKKSYLSGGNDHPIFCMMNEIISKENEQHSHKYSTENTILMKSYLKIGQNHLKGKKTPPDI